LETQRVPRLFCFWTGLFPDRITNADYLGLAASAVTTARLGMKPWPRRR